MIRTARILAVNTIFCGRPFQRVQVPSKSVDYNSDVTRSLKFKEGGETRTSEDTKMARRIISVDMYVSSLIKFKIDDINNNGEVINGNKNIS